MAKVKGQQDTPRRQSRKEFLLTRQQQEQYQQIRLAVIGLVGLLAIVLIAGLIFEFVIKPGQPVATVGGEDIALSDWRNRTAYERLEGIENIESFYEAVGGSSAQLQQFAGQQLTALVYPSVLGEQTLNTMINEKLVAQEAERRGITVSESEIQQQIEERFNFYGGDVVPAPETTATPVPKPTITPIGFDASAETAAPPEPEPTPEPTAVSQEAFDTAYQEAIDDFATSGATEADYRNATKAQILQEKLQDAFGAENELTTEEENVTFYLIRTNDSADADNLASQISSGEVDYVTAWNTVRSNNVPTDSIGTAFEYPWTPSEQISSAFGTELYEAVTTLAVDEMSDVIESEASGAFLIQLIGREVRAVSDGNLTSQKSQLLFDWIEEERKAVTIYDRWADNVPDRPILDPKYLRDDTPPDVTGGSADSP